MIMFNELEASVMRSLPSRKERWREEVRTVVFREAASER